MFDKELDDAYKRASRLRGPNKDPSDLPLPVQTVLTVYWAQGIIGNGGLRYFFEFDWPWYPPYSYFTEAYRRIGAEDAARVLEETVELLFAFENPHLHQAQREAALESPPERFWQLDHQICNDYAIDEKLIEYFRAHRGLFIGKGGAT